MLSALVALSCGGGASTTAQTTGAGSGAVAPSTPNGGSAPSTTGGASSANGGATTMDDRNHGGQGGNASDVQGGASSGGSDVSGGGEPSSPGGNGNAGGAPSTPQTSDVPEIDVVRSVLTGEGTFDCVVDVATDGDAVYVVDRGSSALYDPNTAELIDATFALRKVSFDAGSEWSVPIDGVVAAAVAVSDPGDPVTVALSGASDGSVTGRMLISTRDAADGQETDSWQGEQLVEQSYYGLALAETAMDGSLLLAVSGQLVRYDGAPVWTYAGGEAVYALWTQDDGSFYLAGQVTPERAAEAWVARLDAAGSETWSYREKLTADGQTEFGVVGVAADGEGNAYAVATHVVDEEPGPIRWGLVKVGAGGAAEWRVDLGAYDNYSQNGVQYLVGTVTPADVVIVDDEIVVVGAKDGNLWLAGFDASGQLLWERRHAGSVSGPDEATKAVLLDDGTLLVAGCETIRLEPGNDGSFCANVPPPCEPPPIAITSGWVGIVELP